MFESLDELNDFDSDTDIDIQCMLTSVNGTLKEGEKEEKEKWREPCNNRVWLLCGEESPSLDESHI